MSAAAERLVGTDRSLMEWLDAAFVGLVREETPGSAIPLAALDRGAPAALAGRDRSWWRQWPRSSRATTSRREDLMATRDLARRLAAAERSVGAERVFVVEVPAEASEQQRAAILAERGIAPRPHDTIVFLRRWS